MINLRFLLRFFCKSGPISIAAVLCNLCNRSTQSDIFPSQLKQARVLPLLKKSTADPDKCSSYRPISNLSFISKLIERFVASASPLTYRSSTFFPTQHSAYRFNRNVCPFSLPWPCLLYWYNNQVSLLVLRDLSAAFDHSVLLPVLSNRFRVDGTALDWYYSHSW